MGQLLLLSLEGFEAICGPVLGILLYAARRLLLAWATLAGFSGGFALAVWLR